MIAYTDNTQAATANPVPAKVPMVYSALEVAKILKIGRGAVYHLVQSGQIRCVRIGKIIRIPESALMEYLERASTND